MNAQAQSLLTQPVDFWIKTESSLRYFLLKTKQSKRFYQPSRAMKLCLRLARKIQTGRLDIIMPDGQKLRFEGRLPGRHGVLAIRNDRVARKLMTGGRLGFCECYLSGDWSSPDIANLFQTILENEQVMMHHLSGNKLYKSISRLMHLVQPNSKKGSKKNIYRHYDIGNDFYQCWLDPSMTYSSALFTHADMPLAEAQENKYREMVDRLDLKPEHHVLEIGCGWGGFAEYAAKTIGCKITGITISQAQYDYATKRIKDADLDHLVTLKMCDYRDVQGQYDRIASIEMFEAVGEAYWPSFFDTVKKSLKPGGHAVLQIITIRDDIFELYRKSADYIQLYIFPGGMLPGINALRDSVKNADLYFGDYLAFGRDYARTLKIWNEQFQKQWHILSQKDGFDQRFKRLWEQYLCYCQAGFDAGTIDVIQLAIHNKGHESNHAQND